jgi:hypothetical protein
VHSTAREFESSDAARLRPVLDDVAAVIRKRIHRPWVRGWKSQAADDLAATQHLLRDNGTPWGEAPVSTVLPVTQMLLDAVVQHVQAAQMLLDRGEDVVLPIDAETRAALEGAGQIWWLLERNLASRERVARLYAQRRATSLALDKVLDKMGLAAGIGYGLMPADLDKLYETELQLTVRRRPDRQGVLQWSSCEGQAMPDYTTRVRNFVRDGLGQSPEAGPYAYYCGASHSELWRIQYGYTEQINGDGTSTFVRRAAAATINMAAGACLGALVYSASRAFEYIGDGAGLTELHMRMAEMRNATRMR